MATIKFILREDKGNSRGESPIYAQYKHLNFKTLIATGKKIEPKYWDIVQGKVRKHENAVAMNGFLAKLNNKIMKVVISLQQADLEPTPIRVKEAIAQLEKENKPESILNKSLLFLWNDYVNSKKNSLAPTTISNHFRTIRAMETYLHQSKSELISPENFTLKHLIKWKDFQNKDSKPNTVAKRLKHFKNFLKYFEDLGGKAGIPLTKIKYKEIVSTKIYLTEEELEAFKSAPVSGRLEEIRDLFALQCYTGLRISDLKRLNQNIQGDRIILTTQKTVTQIEIPINNSIRSILTKYANKLPRIPDQKINIGIKKIFCDLFPDKIIQVRNQGKFETRIKGELLTSHDAIRTFITLSAERGMPITSIAKITGKSMPVLIKHYLSESQKVADRDFGKAWG